MRRSFRRLAAVLLGVAWLVAARAAAPPAPPQFVLLGVADGVPSSLVYKIVQDHDGFIWIGTQDGLARYDGVGFQVYRHDPTDPGSLASNDVSALLVDRDGRLWCGGEASGLNRLEADGHTFTHWMHRPNDLSTLGSNDLFSIEQDAAAHRLRIAAEMSRCPVLDIAEPHRVQPVQRTKRTVRIPPLG